MKMIAGQEGDGMPMTELARLCMVNEIARDKARKPPRPLYKHSDSVVQQIREAKGLHREIAERFGVSRAYVGQIKRGIARKKVEGNEAWKALA